MHLGFACMTTDLIRETANEQGNTFEGDQSHPVMGVCHVKPEQRLGEEVIEASHGQQRHDARLKKAPPQCDGSYQKEMNRGRRGEIEMKSVSDPGDKQRCRNSNGDPDSNIVNCSLDHSLAIRWG